MDYEQLADAIAAWMGEYALRAGMQGYVVGLSGGIDSAVTAALAVRALGVEKTLGVLLPCHSQPEDAEHALLLAGALGLDTITVDLAPVCDALEQELHAQVPREEMDVERVRMARANLKPRLRMTTLYFLAQSRAYLVAGTGNRPEMMVGYFTKYGDGGVDIEPLGDLYKHEVRGLARVLDVPEPLVTRAPSAGLWPGQTDEGELGITYDELDAILIALARDQPSPASPETTDRVRRMVATSAHKRAAPPIFPVRRAGQDLAML
jgi:NAD+ synthase